MVTCFCHRIQIIKKSNFAILRKTKVTIVRDTQNSIYIYIFFFYSKFYISLFLKVIVTFYLTVLTFFSHNCELIYISGDCELDFISHKSYFLSFFFSTSELWVYILHFWLFYFSLNVEFIFLKLQLFISQFLLFSHNCELIYISGNCEF